MLGLPSITEVDRHLPKEEFYKRLTMTPALRAEFVDGIDRIHVRNSLKPATMNVPAGPKVGEVLVLEVALKRREVPEGALTAIAAANAHKLLFACTYGDEACLAVLPKDLVVGPWVKASGVTIELRTSNLDQLWDSLASQVVYGDTGKVGTTVEERWENDTKLATMGQRLAQLKSRCGKERQFSRKNELFAQLKELESQIAAFEEGRWDGKDSTGHP